MIAIIQRVTSSRVVVADKIVGQIGRGLLGLVSVHRDDTAEDVAWMARKMATLRIFADGQKHFDKDVIESTGAMLLVSNFTVASETRRGRRPSFDAAAAGEEGKRLFDALIDALRKTGRPVETGEFGADMLVELTNDGPATFILDSRPARAAAT